MPRKRSRPENSQALTNFARRLKMWRLRRNLSQEGLAAKADLDFSHLNELENGKINPSLTTLVRLGEALEVNPSVFFLNKVQAEKVHKLLGLPPEEPLEVVEDI